MTKCPSKYTAKKLVSARARPRRARRARARAVRGRRGRGRGAPAPPAARRPRTRCSPRSARRSSPPSSFAALARRDYSFVYVWQFTSNELPLRYTLSAFWGGQEGSLLFWLVLLTGYSAAAILAVRRTARDLLAWVVPVLGGVALFFSFLLVFVASPFVTQAAPDEGRRLNPSLQNPYMLSHPIFLYLGFVGLTIPFAFAIGSLLARRTDERWIVLTRRTTLVAWTALGIGQLIGSKWAYEEVGWGGFYAWDPVENAALMPWLAATAYLHSVMVQEKRDAPALERHPRRARLLALDLRHLLHPLRDPPAPSTRSRRARSGPGSSPS